MDKKPFFTIGVPVYNTADFLGDCLDSILSQNFTDFEILCVNDGSTDNSLAVLNEYRAKDNRIRIISRPNGGVSSVRNTILICAEGRYINMIDSDDYMVEAALLNAYNHIVKNDYPDVLYGGASFGPAGTDISDARYVYHPIVPEDHYFSTEVSKEERAIKLFLDKCYLSATGAKFVKREFVHHNGLQFNLRYNYGEDSAFSILINRKADKVVIADFIAYHYCEERTGSITSELSNKSYYTFLSYEFDLYSDSRFYTLSQETRKRLDVREKRSVFIATQYLISKMSSKKGEEDFYQCVDIVENFIRGKVNPSVVPSENKSLKNTIIYTQFKLLGVKTTMKLLYSIAKRTRK